nr:hypothetical protein [Tanacetum cinerariifolium]
MLKRCEDTNLCLNWEKSHFMVKEGIVLGHKISKNGIEVDKAKVDVIAKLPHPTTVKGIRIFLSHWEQPSLEVGTTFTGIGNLYCQWELSPGSGNALCLLFPTFLALEDDLTSPGVDHSYYDTEGDILLLEAFLNDDPSLPPPHSRKVELKDLPPHLEYVFLEGDDKFPIIIAKDLSVEEKAALIKVLKSHKKAIAWKLSDIKGINLEFCTHKILMEDDFELAVQHQIRVNLKIHDVIKKEVLKLLYAGLIYHISDSPWLNEATSKDHFPLPFMDQMLERLAGNEYYCFLDGFSGYIQILIDPKDQEKTIFMFPYGTFAYHRMPFGLCNASGTFQRCMMAIFEDMIEKLWKSSWTTSRNGIEVDKAIVDVIAKLPHPTTVKGIRSFLGHVDFYRRFI